MRRLGAISFLLPVLVSTAFIFAGPGLSVSRARPLQTGKLVGTVLDVNDARIVGAAIKIENARFGRRLFSGDEGDFEVELPAGTYQITVQKEGFQRFELSPFRVNGKVCELVSIHMKVREPVSTLKVE
ncbi:MAG TPA: carboxypeptidase-like regulatory domain-containing protein [Pyrinomonadaceae bacterium]|jgi:hypothetical protein